MCEYDSTPSFITFLHNLHSSSLNPITLTHGAPVQTKTRSRGGAENTGKTYTEMVPPWGALDARNRQNICYFSASLVVKIGDSSLFSEYSWLESFGERPLPSNVRVLAVYGPPDRGRRRRFSCVLPPDGPDCQAVWSANCTPPKGPPMDSHVADQIARAVNSLRDGGCLRRRSSRQDEKRSTSMLGSLASGASRRS